MLVLHQLKTCYQLQLFGHLPDINHQIFNFLINEMINTIRFLKKQQQKLPEYGHLLQQPH